jgi:hypothetical protein
MEWNWSPLKIDRPELSGEKIFLIILETDWNIEDQEICI